MALMDFADPRPAAQATQQQGLRQQWEQFLTQPDTRAALLQFGLSMLSPMPAGQTLAGHFAQGVGMAGETVGERQRLRQEQMEADLRRQTSMADIAASRGRIAGDAADREIRREGQQIDRETLGISRQRLGIEQQNADTARLEAQRGTRTGGLTENAAVDARKDAAKMYEEAKRASLDPFAPGPDPGDRKAYIDGLLREWGIPVPESSVKTKPTTSPVPAQGAPPPAGKPAPAQTTVVTPPSVKPGVTTGPVPAPTPGTPPSPAAQVMTSQDWISRNPAAAQELRAGLQHADPMIRQEAARLMEILSKQITDPQSLQEILLLPPGMYRDPITGITSPNG